MLSYVHAFHAGNSADVLKHAVLCQILFLLKQKQKPICVLDCQAGSGVYSLGDERIWKTQEIQEGIVRVLNNLNMLPKEALSFLPADFSEISKNLESNEEFNIYLKIVLEFLKNGKYPGSPIFENAFLDENDEQILCELHPAVFEELRESSKSLSPKPKIHKRDCWEFAVALTPPKIKRGILVIDPSYEDQKDWELAAKTVEKVAKRWRSGVLFVWYPILPHRTEEAEFLRQTCAKSGENVIDAQIRTRDFDEMRGLASLCGSGVLIVNSPWKFDERLSKMLPILAESLCARDFSLKTL